MLPGLMYQRWRYHGAKRGEKEEQEGKGDKIRVAFHLRHGDVATKDVDFIDPWKEVRSIPLKDGVAVLSSLRERSIISKAWDQGKVALQFFSEGKKEEFQSLLSAFPETELHLGTNETVGADIAAMASADVLLASPSSFTALVIALNPDGVALTTRDNPEKFAGLKHLVSQEEVRGGHLTGFDKAFCKARLHRATTRASRDALCGIDPPGGGGGDKEDGKDKEGGPKLTALSVAPSEYDAVHTELSELRKRLLSTHTVDVTVPELVVLMPTDSKIRSLFPSSPSLTHTSECQRNPDRAAFSMQEYQPTVCSATRAKKDRKSGLSVAFAYVVRVVAQAVVNGGHRPTCTSFMGGLGSSRPHFGAPAASRHRSRQPRALGNWLRGGKSHRAGASRLRGY